MGLDMKTKKKLTEETAKRYCTASKKNKTKIIDEFIATTGYNRKYAIHVLKNSAYVKVTHFNNVARQSVQVITKTGKKRKYENTTGKTYNKKSSGCGFFRCICVQNVLCRSFGIISITLLKSSAMMKTENKTHPHIKRDSRQDSQTGNSKTFHPRYFNNTTCKES
ncbi:hypothetical protein [Treponema vincentii]|uniref:hypothetical protein n=1 Tax=Treponema vincentii TaxID=69710 RepID=UPI001E37323C|nr:hypothetical protein [Treponema vincentii]